MVVPTRNSHLSMLNASIDLPRSLLEAFCRRHHIRKLALFGSVLRSDFRPDSDVDVLVAFEPDARIGFVALARMQRELTELLKRPVDLVPESDLKPLIRDEVLSSAEPLYSA